MLRPTLNEYFSILSEEKAKDIIKDSHFQVAEAYSMLGKFYFDCGQGTKAVKFFMKEIEVINKVKPEENIHITKAYSNISSEYYYLFNNKINSAIEYYKRIMN